MHIQMENGKFQQSEMTHNFEYLCCKFNRKSTVK